jgi:hypothetical protein
VNPNETTTQLTWKSSTGAQTEEQPQYPTSSSSEAHCASHLQNAATAVSASPASLQITHKRKPGSNGQPLELTGVNSKPTRVPEGDVRKGSTEYHARVVAHHSSSEREFTRLELERQLSDSLAVQTERDHRITQLTALLEQAETKSAEAAKRADRLVMQTSLMEQRNAELVDMQAKLYELVVSRDQQVGQYEKELANVRAKLEAKESELEAVRLRLTDAEKAKNKAEADTLRAQIATGSVIRDEDQFARRLIERMRAIDIETASKRWDEKSIEEMECRNEE